MIVQVTPVMVICDVCGTAHGPYMGGSPAEARAKVSGWTTKPQPNRRLAELTGPAMDVCPACSSQGQAKKA